MAALDGTIKTPFGQVPKKTALLVGGGIVLVGGIVWYRQKATANKADANASTTDSTEIDPATGYPYGSAEDAAALAAQAAYVTPNNSSSSSSSSTPVYASTNAQWVQNVLSYMQDNGIMSDVSGLAVSLGKYITGAYLTDSDVSLVQQAIAVEGQPPVAGASGYPPSMNRTPPSTTPTTPSGSVGAITGRKTNWGQEREGVRQTWNAAPNAIKYQIKLDGKLVTVVTGLVYEVTGLKPGSHHTISIVPVGANGALGPTSNSTGSTKK